MHRCSFFSAQWFGEQLQKHYWTAVHPVHVCHDRVMLQSTNQLFGLNYEKDQGEFSPLLCEIILNKLLYRKREALVSCGDTYFGCCAHCHEYTIISNAPCPLCSKENNTNCCGLIKQWCIHTEISHHAFLEIAALEANKASEVFQTLTACWGTINHFPVWRNEAFSYSIGGEGRKKERCWLSII